MSENQIDEKKVYAEAINEMRILQEKKTPAIVLNKEFTIQPEVFHPNVCLNLIEYINSEILKLVEEEIKERSDNVSFDFLEVGCGAGYTSVLVALSSQKCRVWATDINEAAVENTKENAKFHGVENRVKPAVADVFNSDELKGRKFDMIYWNSPWAGQHTDKTAEIDDLTKSIIDPGYRSLRRFLSETGSFLKATGRLVVAFSFSVGSEEFFRSIANDNGWKLEICSSENLTYELNGMSEIINVVTVEFQNK